MNLRDAEAMVERLVSKRVGYWESESTDRLSDGDLIALWGVLVQKRLLLQGKQAIRVRGVAEEDLPGDVRSS